MMSIEQTVTCNSCGKAETVKSIQGVTMFGWGAPQGWLTVTAIGPSFGTALPENVRRQRPDLCSWACVADYAASVAAS